MGDMMLAYAINPADTGWRWRVFDAEGELVADGMAQSQAEAESAVADAFDRSRQVQAS